MKKIIVLACILFLVFVLCSCANGAHTETIAGTEEKTVEKAMEKTAENLVSNAAREEKNMDGLAIVFMGETITAPGSYQGVPDAYAPVLDDVYLSGMLYLRYRVQESEDGYSKERRSELDTALNDVLTRGYLIRPYSDLEGATAYALMDLNNDDSPELLLLAISSETGKEETAVFSVFTIRNGEFIHIESDASDLRYFTVLADDGIFYQYRQRELGRADLYALQLEEGAAEFTTIWEANTDVSFADGDVPVAFWIKKENGEETNISEEEFDGLLEKHKNPSEKMKLDYEVLPSEMLGIDLIPYGPEEERPSWLKEYPESYQDAPKEYKIILDDLYAFSESIRRNGLIEEFWGNTGFVEYPFPHDEPLAYAVADINNDGVLELLLGNIKGLKAACPNSIFTISNGEAVLVDSFWTRSSGVIAADGIIYNTWADGAGEQYLWSFKLEKNADTLTKLTDLRSDYSEANEKPYYAQVVNGKNQYISEEEFSDSFEKYSAPPEILELEVFPIAH